MLETPTDMARRVQVRQDTVGNATLKMNAENKFLSVLKTHAPSIRLSETIGTSLDIAQESLR